MGLQYPLMIEYICKSESQSKHYDIMTKAQPTACEEGQNLFHNVHRHFIHQPSSAAVINVHYDCTHKIQRTEL